MESDKSIYFMPPTDREFKDRPYAEAHVPHWHDKLNHKLKNEVTGPKYDHIPDTDNQCKRE